MPQWLKGPKGWISKPAGESQSNEGVYRRDSTPMWAKKNFKLTSLRKVGRNDAFVDEVSDSGSEEEEYEYSMSISELLYSTASFYAMIIPGE